MPLKANYFATDEDWSFIWRVKKILFKAVLGNLEWKNLFWPNQGDQFWDQICCNFPYENSQIITENLNWSMELAHIQNKY